MLFFAKMTEKKLGNTIGVCLGTDSFLRLDGRNNMNNMIKECKRKMSKNESWIGFRIYKGSIRDPYLVYHEPKDNEVLKNEFLWEEN